jgi:tRNA(fMet)-specific endonuclease VapC
MRYLLDTNAVIGILRGRSRSLLARYVTVPRVRICTCSPVRAELFYGSLRSAKPAENRAKQEEFLDELLSLDFDDRAAEAYAEREPPWRRAAVNWGRWTTRSLRSRSRTI